MSDEVFAAPPPGKFLVDPYQEWIKGEGVPIHTGAAIDLLTAETKPWARFGLNGASCHLDGRDDFLSVFLIELPARATSAPQEHLYEEVCYVLAGSGRTEIETAGGQKTIEWGPRSLFAVPMNARYRHRNEGDAPARFAAVNDLRYLLSLYRSEAFVFDTSIAFPERRGGTLLISDLAAHAAEGQITGGVGRSALMLANGSIGTDVVELAPGTYQQAFRQMQGSHLFAIDGEGYTLVWEEDGGDFQRMEWRHGIVFAPPGMAFHQHFNAGRAPARYLDLQYGSLHYPLFRHRRAAYGDTEVYAAGNATIALSDQDPLIHRLWRDTIAAKGIASRMPLDA